MPRAGTGALLLFGSLQLTMLGLALWSGERAYAGEWFVTRQMRARA